MKTLIILTISLFSIASYAQQATVGENLAAICENSPQGNREPKEIVVETEVKEKEEAPKTIQK